MRKGQNMHFQYHLQMFNDRSRKRRKRIFELTVGIFFHGFESNRSCRTITDEKIDVEHEQMTNLFNSWTDSSITAIYCHYGHQWCQHIAIKTISSITFSFSDRRWMILLRWTSIEWWLSSNNTSPETNEELIVGYDNTAIYVVNITFLSTIERKKRRKTSAHFLCREKEWLAIELFDVRSCKLRQRQAEIWSIDNNQLQWPPPLWEWYSRVTSLTVQRCQSHKRLSSLISHDLFFPRSAESTLFFHRLIKRLKTIDRLNTNSMRLDGDYDW